MIQKLTLENFEELQVLVKHLKENLTVIMDLFNGVLSNRGELIKPEDYMIPVDDMKRYLEICAVNITRPEVK